MTFRDVDTIEKVAVKFVIELRIERLTEVLSSRPQNLIWSHWRTLWLLLHHRQLVLWWWRKVGVPVQVPFLELDRFDLHSLDLLEIFFIV
jgi:hypothetical protein